MRIQLLKDSLGASESQFQPRSLASVAANDVQPQISRLPNPAETYLMSLAAGSRRTMAQALRVVAKVIEPASTAATLDWTRVSYGDVARVRAALSERYSPNMANKVLAALRGVMKATFRLGLIDSDSLTRALDVRRVRGGRITRGRSLDTDEIARLIAVCDRFTAIGVRNAAIIAVGFSCGLRRAEIVALDVADVLEDGAALRVRGKGNKERLVYTSNSTREHIAAWLQHRSNNPGALFCAANRSSVRVQTQVSPLCSATLSGNIRRS